MTITVLGDAFVDILTPVHDIKPGGTYYDDVSLACGGTANVAVQAARLGQKVNFMGKVGNDVLGRYFKEDLTRNGVEDMTVTDAVNPTGVCLSLHYSSGERTLIATRGANDYLSKDDIGSRFGELFQSRVIYCSGYSFLSKITSEGVIHAVRESRRQGCEIWFNPGAPNLINSVSEALIREVVDVLILNLEEAKALTGKDSDEEIATELGRMVNSAVVTWGKDGCLLVRRGERGVHVETEPIDFIADSTGAGDAFAAGFMVGKLRNLNPVESARLGHRTAADLMKGRRKVQL